jgi:HlyD family secretion protein
MQIGRTLPEGSAMRRVAWILLVLLLVGVAAWYLHRGKANSSIGFERVRVVRGTVVRRATAVGRIEVEHEVSVNSQNGGILTKLFVRQGQKVEAGTPLADVRPVSTEQAILAAERRLEQAVKGEESAQEYLDGKHLASDFTRLMLGGKNIERMHENAVLSRKQAEEQLELLRNGTAKVDDRVVDFLVRAPVAGHVLEIKQREGSPVVPSSSYGFGTVFMTLADMSQMLFRGTIDEIDVGRLTEGMAAQIKVGALPGTVVNGKLVEIALKGQERNNAMVFDVLINIETPPKTILRSGYSAVAEIEIDKRTNVLTLPERVVEFRDGKAFVQVAAGGNGGVRHEISTGLSDGLTLEILGGLAESEEVLERIYKQP